MCLESKNDLGYSYEPLVGFDCALPNDKKDAWILIQTKQNHF